jgi:hypothetical protein
MRHSFYAEAYALGTGYLSLSRAGKAKGLQGVAVHMAAHVFRLASRMQYRQ